MVQREDFRTYFDRSRAEKRVVIFPTGMGSEVSALGAEQNPPYILNSTLWVVGAILDSKGQAIIQEAHRNTILMGATDVITTPTWTRRTAVKDFLEQIEKPLSALALRELSREEIKIPQLIGNWEDVSREIFARGTELSLEIRDEMEQKVGRPLYVGGSFGPLADAHNYRVDERLARHFTMGAFGPLARDYDCGLAEALSNDYYLPIHKETASILAGAGKGRLDFLIPETINNYFDAYAMAKASSETGLPFVLGLRPNKDGSFPDGSNLSSIIDCVKNFPGFTALAINCVPPEWVDGILKLVRMCYDGELIVCANGPGEPHPNQIDWIHDISDSATEGFGNQTTRWVKEHTLIGAGACCGTRAHIHGPVFNGFRPRGVKNAELCCGS